MENPMHAVDHKVFNKTCTVEDLATLPLGARIRYDGEIRTVFRRIPAQNAFVVPSDALLFSSEVEPNGKTYTGEEVMNIVNGMGEGRVIGTVPVAGVPATYCIGSDSYAIEVTEVVYAKGASPMVDFPRLVRYKMHGGPHEATARKRHDDEHMPVVFKDKGSKCGTLYFGHGETRLDPGF